MPIFPSGSQHAVADDVLQRALTLWLPLFGIAGAMLCFALFLYQNALNVPFADDIRDVLHFLTSVSQSQHWPDTLESFFSQHNEHRTTATRLVYYLAYAIEGEANFRTLIFLANLALPLLLLMLYLCVQRQPRALLILLPAALILFQLRFYGTSFWSMNAFAFMFVYVYGFAALYALQACTGRGLSAAILFASLATFTLASGQLVWLVGLACLLHKRLLGTASTAHCVIWTVSAVAVLMVFRVNYVNPTSTDLILAKFFAAPLEVIAVFLVLLGRAFSDSNVVVAASAGAAMLFVVVFSSLRGIQRDDNTLEFFIWFIVLSMLVIAIARMAVLDKLGMSGQWHLMAFSERYVFPSVLLLATTVVLLGARIPLGKGRRQVNAIAILLALFYCVSSYQYYPQRLREILYVVVVGHNIEDYWAFADFKKESNRFVSEAVAAGIYHPPPRPLSLPRATVRN